MTLTQLRAFRADRCVSFESARSTRDEMSPRIRASPELRGLDRRVVWTGVALGCLATSPAPPRRRCRGAGRSRTSSGSHAPPPALTRALRQKATTIRLIWALTRRPSTLRRPVRADPRVAPVSPPTQDRRGHRGRLGTPGKGQGGMRDPGACPTPNERREKAHS